MKFCKNTSLFIVFFLFCVSIKATNNNEEALAQAPLFLFDKEGNPRCQIVGTGEHGDYLLSERLREFVQNAPEDVRPLVRELADLRECDQRDAFYARIELNPEEIIAAAAINPTSAISKNALMAGGVYVAALLGACPVGQLNNKYFEGSWWPKFWGGVAWASVASLIFQRFVSVGALPMFFGVMPIFVVHDYCHKNTSNSSPDS